MGRRALRKIDPSLDLGRHLKSWDQLPKPAGELALFDRAAPLEIEIGSGKGLFLAAAASEQPERNFLGIEIVAKYARFAAARLATRELRNALMVHGDGQRLLTELLPDDSVAAIHVYFPDPWWKARHRKRRVMNAAFVVQVQRVLAPRGRLHFWTDVEEYFHSALAILAESTRLTGPLPVTEQPATHDLDYRTHFERRMRLHGQAIHRAEFQKGERGE